MRAVGEFCVHGRGPGMVAVRVWLRSERGRGPGMAAGGHGLGPGDSALCGSGDPAPHGWSFHGARIYAVAHCTARGRSQSKARLFDEERP